MNRSDLIDELAARFGNLKQNDIDFAANTPDGHSKCPTYGQSNCSTPTTVN